MDQQMENQYRFEIDTVPNDYCDFAQAPTGTIKSNTRNLLVLERPNRLRLLEIESTRRRCMQIKVGCRFR
jgi:hypothetical protein